MASCFKQKEAFSNRLKELYENKDELFETRRLLKDQGNKESYIPVFKLKIKDKGGAFLVPRPQLNANLPYQENDTTQYYNT